MENQITYNNLSTEQRLDLKNDLTYWLLSHRLNNYGYDWREFRKLSSKASRLRSKIKRYGINIDQNYGILNRLIIKGRDFDYITGQSFNEELITLLDIFSDWSNKKC